MRPWFWGWLVTFIVLAVVSALARDRASAPFAAGAAAATALEALRASPGWEWAAFLCVSMVLFVAVNRERYRGRHVPGGTTDTAPPPGGEGAGPAYRPRHSQRRSGRAGS